MNEQGKQAQKFPEKAVSDSSKREFFSEAWPRRNKDLLLQKIVAFMERQGFPPADVRERYDQQKELLTSLFGDSDIGLKQDLLFHGTGKSKYGGEKYKEGVRYDEIVPVLPGILRNGLLPHHDKWAREGEMTSASLARSYFYSKYYALKYEQNPAEIKWQFGDQNDWVYYFLADSLKSVEIKDILAYLKNKVTKTFRGAQIGPNQLIQWVSSLRNDVSEETTFKELLAGHTTIPDNWGAVLCIDNAGLSLTRPVGIGAHEGRVKQTILPNRIKAVGVPMVHTVEAQKMVVEAGSATPIFNLECSDLHLAQFPIAQLAERF